MSRVFARLCVPLLLLAAVAPAPAAEDDRIAPLLAYLDGLESFAADFTQQRYDEDGSLLERAAGSARIRRPGRFRWVYQTPWEQTIVSDGETLWIHDVDLEQVTVTAVGDAPPDSPAALLGQDIDVTAHYAITVAPRAEDGLEWFELVPRAAQSDFARIALGFDAGEVRAMRLTDNLGQRTEIAFSAVERNVALDDGLFGFVPPPGVDIVRGAVP